MTISELITKLQELKDIHGDLAVKTYEPDWMDYYDIDIPYKTRDDDKNDIIMIS
jgi:hypothetical protein